MCDCLTFHPNNEARQGHLFTALDLFESSWDRTKWLTSSSDQYPMWDAMVLMGL